MIIIKNAFSKALGFAFSISYICKETVKLLISKAGQHEKILEKFIKSDGSKKTKDTDEKKEEIKQELGEKLEENKEEQKNKKGEENLEIKNDSQKNQKNNQEENKK